MIISSAFSKLSLYPKDDLYRIVDLPQFGRHASVTQRPLLPV
jgi:hypothetical protein